MSAFRTLDEIPPLRYGLIMADPPWSFDAWSDGGNKKNAKQQYDCLSLQDIKAMPVGHFASRDCVLWLWATNPLLDRAVEVLKAWGFEFKTAGHWSKRNADTGKQWFGTGYILRGAGEPFLIGTVGNPWTAKNVRSVIEGPVREHSRKPEEAFAAAERLCGDVPRLELFSRQERPGWDAFGNEVGKFAVAGS